MLLLNNNVVKAKESTVSFFKGAYKDIKNVFEGITVFAAE